MNQLRKLASYVVEGSSKPVAPPSPQGTPTLTYKHLDLTYVTSRLLVGGRAIDGPTDKKSCVNNSTEIKAYLEAAHSGKYLLFNLCDENAETATISPQTLDFSWERDSGIRTYTPPADHIFRICYAIFGWLALDADNVVVLYCHNGKTRSGVICACYFLFVRTVDEPMSALAQFYQKRLGIDTLTPEYVKRSMPISIQRFVSNFATIMENQSIPNPEPLLLKAIMFRALPVDLQPLIQLWDDEKMIFSSSIKDDTQIQKPVIDWNPEDGFLAILWETGIPLDGGFSILCSFGDDYDDNETDTDPSSRVLFRYMDSTWFLNVGLVTLKKSSLDMMKQYEHGFEDENFSVDMVFHSSSITPKAYVPVNYTGNYAVKQGIVEIASHHEISPDPSIYLNFVKNGFDATASTFALQRAQNSPNLALDILHSEGISTIFTRLEPLTPSPPKVLVNGGDRSKSFSFPSEPKTPTTNQCTAITTNDESIPSRRHSNALHGPQSIEPTPIVLEKLNRRYSSDLSNMSASAKDVKPSEGTNFQEAVCCVCREEDYVLRPQLVRCSSMCQKYFHTNCAGLKKIPFGLTTLSDRTNHASYIKKFFSTWQCSECKSQVPTTNSTTRPISNGNTSPKSPTKQKLEKLRLLLDEKGLSLDELIDLADGRDSPRLPSIEKYQKMLDNGVPFEAVQNGMVRDGIDPKYLNGCERNFKIPIEEIKPQVLLLKDAIQFEGYFTMLQKGCTKDAVKHKMKMCGLNPAILDLNPNSVYSEVRDEIENLQAQYGLPRSPPKTTQEIIAVKLKNEEPITINESDVNKGDENKNKGDENKNKGDENMNKGDENSRKQIEEPEKAPAPETEKSNEPSKPLILKDDPVYGKYFKMLKMNIPEGAVRQKMIEHGVNLKALELGPDSLVSALEDTKTIDEEKPSQDLLKDDPVYGKYFKMLKMNIPEGAVRQKMIEHGVNLKALELGPDGLVSALTEKEPDRILLKDDPVYGKYFKMLKMNIPEGAVRQKMIEHGVNLKALELGPDGLVSALTEKETMKILLKDDPVYGKYFKMLKMNIPEAAVKQKMIEHGVNVKALDLGPDGAVEDLTKEIKTMLKDDPVYGKYFKMLKMNIPEAAVKQKMIEHGVNVKALELGPDGFLTDLLENEIKPKKMIEKKLIRRKKIFWQPIPEDRLKRSSSTIWEYKQKKNIQLDLDEIETLFFKDTKITKKLPSKIIAKKQIITLIDGKKAMNTAIALARIKLTYEEIAQVILNYDTKSLTLEQLTTINEYFPTEDEIQLIQRYNGDYLLLGEAEKFFFAISKIPRFSIKMNCLISKISFHSNIMELTRSIENVIDACNDVKKSELFQLLLGTVLKLGNTLNGGDESEDAIRGFSVDSLLRLGHTKTNDQKTTVLHYLIRVIRKNQCQVLEFQNELQHVPLAARESIETMDHILISLKNQVENTNEEYLRMKNEKINPIAIQAYYDAIEQGNKELNEIENQIEKMKHEISTVFDYFGEDPTKKPSEFFQTLASFCSAFEKAKQQVQAADEAKLRAEKNIIRPRASTDAILLDPIEKSKLKFKNSFTMQSKRNQKEMENISELDRTASSRF